MLLIYLIVRTAYAMKNPFFSNKTSLEDVIMELSSIPRLFLWKVPKFMLVLLVEGIITYFRIVFAISLTIPPFSFVFRIAIEVKMKSKAGFADPQSFAKVLISSSPKPLNLMKSVLSENIFVPFVSVFINGASFKTSQVLAVEESTIYGYEKSTESNKFDGAVTTDQLNTVEYPWEAFQNERSTNDSSSISNNLGRLGMRRKSLSTPNLTELHDIDAEANPDAYLPTDALIQNQGYPVETHQVVTEDGYILTVHRIPKGRKAINNPGARRVPVYLQHGFLCSSADWVLLPSQKALPFILADAGFDVWLGNARGNNYSKDHVKYNVNSSAFWNFSMHEMGVYDLPAVMDYMLGKSGAQKLIYIGHSMGCNSFYICMSERPEYSKKVLGMIGLAPAVYLGRINNVIVRFLSFLSPFQMIYSKISHGALFPDVLQKLLLSYAPTMCNPKKPMSAICNNLIFAVNGYNAEQITKHQVHAILGHTPSSTSAKTSEHLFQTMRSKSFQMYDEGVSGNVQKYGQLRPPLYDLKKSLVPVGIYYAPGDTICVPTDIEQLASELPNLIHIKKVKYTRFTHVDFMYAQDAHKLLYYDIVHTIRKFEHLNHSSGEE